MDDRQFSDMVDEIFVDIEDQVDDLDLDIDIDTSGGVLTFSMPDGSSIILSRQIGAHEIWVAARSGGFHLALKDDVWHCGTTNETLSKLLNRVFTEQGAEISFA